MKKLTFTILCKINIQEEHRPVLHTDCHWFFNNYRHILASAISTLYEVEDDVEDAPSNCNRSHKYFPPATVNRFVGAYFSERSKSKSSKLNLIPSSGSIWETGKKLFNYIRKQTFEGRTGRVAFDAMGDRVFAEYKIINIFMKFYSYDKYLFHPLPFK